MNSSQNCLEEILRRLKKDPSRLPTHLLENLAGTIQIELRDTGESCSIEPTTGREIPATTQPDATIRMHSGDARRILAGDLNPQIAMLSGKIQLEGRAGLAVYLFNVLAMEGNNS